MLLRNRFNLFDDFFDDVFDNAFVSRGNVPQLMRTDIQENDEAYVLDIELPGYDKKDVQADLKDGYLTIAAKREHETTEKDKKTQYLRKERYTGSIKRSFYVGEEVKEEDIKAGFQDGILRIVIRKDQPKVVEEEHKFIPIQ